MKPERGENYYVNVKPKLMKGFDKSSKGIVNVLKQHFNESKTAICKFYKKQDAERYIPYLCLGDYSMFRAFGVGMKRTQTIGNGAEFCDFRFKKNGVTQKGWPPENLEEFRGDKR